MPRRGLLPGRRLGADTLARRLPDYRAFELGLGTQVTEGLYQLDEAVYEWLGLAYYRLLGWTPALFQGRHREAARLIHPRPPTGGWCPSVMALAGTTPFP